MANEGQKDIPGLKAHKPNVAELRWAACAPTTLHPLYVQHLLRWAADEIARLIAREEQSPPAEEKKVEFREFF